MSKPKITIAGTDRFNLVHRGIKAQVWFDSGSSRWDGAIFGRDSDRLRPSWTSDDIGRQVIAAIDSMADCDDALVRADKFIDGAGGRAIIELGGQAALDLFEAALGELATADARALPLVEGMIRAASRKRLALAVEVEADRSSLTIVPGFSVAFAGGPTYYIGCTAEYDSYNLHYFGTIESITAKTITIRPRSGGSARRLRLADFARRNEDTPDSKAEANAETMMCI